MTEAVPARVVLVSRSPLFADAATRSLEGAGILIVASLAPTPDGIEALRETAANAALVETGGSIEETAALLRRIQALASLPIIVVGVSVDDAQRVELIEAGCCGCVARDASLRELVEAVRNACCGRAECSPYLAALVSSRIRELARDLAGDADTPALTHREHEVLRLAARGLSNKEIAQQLGVWLQTIKTHLHNIFEKLEVRTRRAAVAKAFRLGLVDDA
jgi:two-component system nitrate/nitrite response regulator NarL